MRDMLSLVLPQLLVSCNALVCTNHNSETNTSAKAAQKPGISGYIETRKQQLQAFIGYWDFTKTVGTCATEVQLQQHCSLLTASNTHTGALTVDSLFLAKKIGY
ncbi:hypothetical protein [Filimonas effusa]|uniref:Uncharacterized protein n=1 Tax=Filimonas effusa TaxID=2508721 RepID=A0A4Q1DB26_9BACT|nr:hypothetical protein [Filimonas effusa]RXK86480.1 hypothetical protein ESB13_06640 [Filimonas effusa]